MARDKLTAQPRIYLDDARYLKNILGKKLGLTTYADIVHQLVAEDQNKEQSLESQLDKYNSELENLQSKIAKLQAEVEKLNTQVKAISLTQSTMTELAGDYMHKTQYNLSNPEFGYLSPGTGTESGEWQEALKKAKEKIKNAQEKKASHLGGKKYE